MWQNFQVKPVKKYKAGYPKKGFFRKSFVSAVPLRIFSFFIVGLLFFITVPGCQEEKLTGEAVPDYDVENTDNSVDDTDNGTGDDIAEDADFIPDREINDMDELGGVEVPECTTDEDCEEGYYCDLSTNTCVTELGGEAVPECQTDEDCEDGFYCDMTTFTCEEELLGDAVPECMTDEDCNEGFYCDTETYTCVEEMLGDPVPDQEVDEDTADTEEVPDEELGGIAPPELKS